MIYYLTKITYIDSYKPLVILRLPTVQRSKNTQLHLPHGNQGQNICLRRCLKDIGFKKVFLRLYDDDDDDNMQSTMGRLSQRRSHVSPFLKYLKIPL